jgi:hypothetical protein
VRPLFAILVTTLLVLDSHAGRTASDESCGQELSTDAEVPQLLAKLFEHVAGNMARHARAADTSARNGRRERDALVTIAADYGSIASAATRAARTMKSMAGAGPAEHDRTKLAGPDQAKWMREKIALQRALAAMLVEHARRSQAVLVELERGE